MKSMLLRFIAFVKGLMLLLKPHLLFGWLRHPFLFTSNTLSLSKWISSQKDKDILNDFYSPMRNYDKRYQLYDHISDRYNLKKDAVDYLEFGVCGGYSFEWWLKNCENTDSRFFGFDTFEGLPESWGTFKKGDMSATIPETNDPRAEFIKGLFQESVPPFLNRYNLQNNKRKVIHLDADLFSSTLYALTRLAPFIKKGDILIFDEFNVPNHEFYAYRIFTESYYVKTKLIAAVNNYFQVAFIVE